MDFPKCTRCGTGMAVVEKGAERICILCADKERVKLQVATAGGTVIENKPDKPQSPKFVSCEIVGECEDGQLYQIQTADSEKKRILRQVLENRQHSNRKYRTKPIAIVPTTVLVDLLQILEMASNADPLTQEKAKQFMEANKDDSCAGTDSLPTN